MPPAHNPTRARVQTCNPGIFLWLGFEPEILWCVDQFSNHWTTWARLEITFKYHKSQLNLTRFSINRLNWWLDIGMQLLYSKNLTMRTKVDSVYWELRISACANIGALILARIGAWWEICVIMGKTHRNVRKKEYSRSWIIATKIVKKKK